MCYVLFKKKKKKKKAEEKKGEKKDLLSPFFNLWKFGLPLAASPARLYMTSTTGAFAVVC